MNEENNNELLNKKTNTINNSLFEFQINLTAQFQKAENEEEDFFDKDASFKNDSGLSFLFQDPIFNEEIRLFFSLKTLKYVQPNVKYQKLFFTRGWLRGFTHFRGENHSVIDLQSLFKPGYIKSNVEIESHLLIFKDYLNMRYSIITRDLSLFNLNNQYYAMSVEHNPDAPEVVLTIDEKVNEILLKTNKKINNELSFIATNTVDINNNKGISLNLAHIQKYEHIYSEYIKNINKINSYSDYTRKAENISILYFARSFFIDEQGVLGIEVDVEKLQLFLFNIK